MAKKFITKSNIIERINSDGEVTHVETHKEIVHVSKSDSFYMLYSGYTDIIMQLKNLSDVKVFAVLCDMAEFNTGAVHMNKLQREALADLSGVSYTNLSKNLKRLSDVGAIALDDGSYIINPEVFWKGDLATRNNVLKEKSISFRMGMEVDKKRKVQ